jgi:ribonucleoside-diphosphate reductase alpha chain
VSELIEIETEKGTVIKCTPEHKIFTKNRGWVEAQFLEETDELLMTNKRDTSNG